MISGGEHKEWPQDLLGINRRIEEMQLELQSLKEHEEATWDWLLELGPPQDDDIVWLKEKLAKIYGYGYYGHPQARELMLLAKEL